MNDIVKQAIVENMCVKHLTEQEAEKEDWYFELTRSDCRKFTIDFDVISKEVERRVMKKLEEAIDEAPILDIIKEYSDRFMLHYTPNAPAHDYGMQKMEVAIKDLLKGKDAQASLPGA